MKALNKYEERAKEYRRLRKRWRELQDAKFNLGWVILDKPKRHGFYKELVLREDIAKRKEAPIYLEILEATKVKLWGSSLKRLEKSWVEQSLRNKRIQYPGIQAIEKKEYDLLSGKAKRFFIFRRSEVFNGYRTNLYISKLPAYFFKFKISRAYIFKRRIIDSEIEREIKEIENLWASKYYEFVYGRNNEAKWYRDLQRDGKLKSETEFFKESLYADAGSIEKFHESLKRLK